MSRSLQVLTAAETDDLVVRSQVKAALNISGSDWDDRLDWMIPALSGAFADYIGRPLTRRQVRDRLPAYGDLILPLSLFPVEVDDWDEPTTVVVYHDDVQIEPANDWRVHSDERGELYRESGWTWTAPRDASSITRDPLAGLERPDWRVEYWSGWWTAAHSGNKPTNAHQIPRRVEGLFYRAVQSLRKRDPDVKSERVGPAAFTYADPSEILPEEVRIGLREFMGYGR